MSGLLTLPERVVARIGRMPEVRAQFAIEEVSNARVKFAAPLVTTGKNAAKVEPVDEAEDPEGEGIKFSGYATVFDVESEVYFGFYRMKIKRGAFKQALADESLDARFMVNHVGLAYASTEGGTLHLEERPRGLYHVAYAADVPEMRTLATLVERRDMKQMSFAAWISEDEWETCDCTPDDVCECIWTRHIHKFGKFDEASVVTFPAIAASDVTVTRASEDSGERNTPASDAERCESAPEDASTSVDASDPNEAGAIWAFAIRTGVTLHGSDSDPQRGTA